jgi:hypothetical protein
MHIQRLSALLLAAALIALGAPADARAATRLISFSGRTWWVKSGTSPMGPGPNYFSDSTSSVWVDSLGRLHMKIAKVRGKWQCAEVVCTESLGLGTYRFRLASPVNSLDPNVVLGLFTWNDAPEFNHREIDIEFSRWGQVTNPNAQYVVQPYTLASNIFRYTWPAGVAASSHSFTWRAGEVRFESVDETTNATLAQWTCANGVPQPGGENARINLWLRSGLAPTNGKAVEVIVSGFEFVPAAP